MISVESADIQKAVFMQRNLISKTIKPNNQTTVNVMISLDREVKGKSIMLSVRMLMKLMSKKWIVANQKRSYLTLMRMIQITLKINKKTLIRTQIISHHKLILRMQTSIWQTLLRMLGNIIFWTRTNHNLMWQIPQRRLMIHTYWFTHNKRNNHSTPQQSTISRQEWRKS